MSNKQIKSLDKRLDKLKEVYTNKHQTQVIQLQLYKDYSLLAAVINEKYKKGLQHKITKLLEPYQDPNWESDDKWHKLPVSMNGGSVGGVKGLKAGILAILLGSFNVVGEQEVSLHVSPKQVSYMDIGVDLLNGPLVYTDEELHKRKVDTAVAVTTVKVLGGVETVDGKYKSFEEGTRFRRLFTESNPYELGPKYGLVVSDRGKMSDGIESINQCLEAVEKNAIMTCKAVTGEVVKKSEKESRKKEQTPPPQPSPKANTGWFSSPTLPAPNQSPTEVVIPNKRSIDTEGYKKIHHSNACEGYIQLPKFTVLPSEQGEVTLTLDYPITAGNVNLEQITYILNELLDIPNIQEEDRSLLVDFSTFLATDYAKLHYTFLETDTMWSNYPVHTLTKVVKQCAKTSQSLNDLLSGQTNQAVKDLMRKYSKAEINEWVQAEAARAEAIKEKAMAEKKIKDAERKVAELQAETERLAAKQTLEAQKAKDKVIAETLRAEKEAELELNKIKSKASRANIKAVVSYGIGLAGDAVSSVMNAPINAGFDSVDNLIDRFYLSVSKALRLNTLAGKIIAGILFCTALGVAGGTIYYYVLLPGITPILLFWNVASGIYTAVQFVFVGIKNGVKCFLPMILYRGTEPPTTSQLVDAIQPPVATRREVSPERLAAAELLANMRVNMKKGGSSIRRKRKSRTNKTYKRNLK